MKAISDKDLNFLLNLSKRFNDEAVYCKKNGQILASCVMYAAEMEASILAMALVHQSEVIGSKTYQQESRRHPDLLEWQLKPLLDLSRELNWIPSSLPVGQIARTSGIDPDDALKRGDVGYFADVVREVRDMVHPGRYVRLWSGVPLTNEYVKTVEETVALVIKILDNKVHESIKKRSAYQEMIRRKSKVKRAS